MAGDPPTVPKSPSRLKLQGIVHNYLRKKVFSVTPFVANSTPSGDQIAADPLTIQASSYEPKIYRLEQGQPRSTDTL